MTHPCSCAKLTPGMRFEALATDYDGTLACHGQVAPPTIAALERLRASNRRAFLVTGREIEELKGIFPRLDLFEAVVAENGGLLYNPSNGELKALHEPPSREFLAELRARGVTPLAVGHVLVATREPNEAVVLEVIKELGLELKIVFNKGAVMVLPSGVNKATGLAAALKATGLSPETCVGVGDAENDHAFIEYCGYGVAVQNALDSLKARADYVTAQPDGAGVTELIELLLADKLARKPTLQRKDTISITH
jgi:hydroxymethylpyrimidine pyrophosphatase-like HAD family hydrolase